MTKLIYIALFLTLTAGLAYHFAALQIFNWVMPKDEHSRLVKANVTYGPDPLQKLDVYAPDQASAALPVIVFVHGGSWSSGSKEPYEFVGRALAAQGYIVFVPGYRKHPAHPFPAFVEDAALALDWAARHAGDFGGEPTQIVAMGHSAGAYNVALAVLDKRYLARLGNDGASIKAVVTLAGPFDFLPLDGPITKDVFGKIVDLPATQPVHFARSDAPPFLILHGSADTTVLMRNPNALNNALQKVGAMPSIKIYPGVSHAGIMLTLAKPLRQKTPVLRDVTEFLARLLPPRKVTER